MECGNARIMFYQKNWKTLRKDIKSFNMIEGGYLTNMGAIRRGLEIIWDKKQFLLHPPLQLKFWLVPKYVLYKIFFKW